MENRRRGTRIFFEDTVRYETESMSLATIAYDISPNAIFVKTLRPLPVGSQVVLHIPQLISQRPRQRISAVGTVIGTRDQKGAPRGMIVKFDFRMSRNLKRLLVRYIRENRFYISGAQYLKSMYEIDDELSSN